MLFRLVSLRRLTITESQLGVAERLLSAALLTTTRMLRLARTLIKVFGSAMRVGLEEMRSTSSQREKE